jgi:hypothetical protein
MKNRLMMVLALFGAVGGGLIAAKLVTPNRAQACAPYSCVGTGCDDCGNEACSPDYGFQNCVAVSTGRLAACSGDNVFCP